MSLINDAVQDITNDDELIDSKPKIKENFDDLLENDVDIESRLTAIALRVLALEEGAVEVTGVQIDQETASIGEGQTLQLSATVLPENATNKNVTWRSSNEAIATVDENGVVTAVEEGSATITVETEQNGFVDTCALTIVIVAVSVTGVSLSQNTATMSAGDTLQLTKTISPANATNKNVTWSSSNSTIATVSSVGLVTAVATGSVIITVTTVDGNFTDTCLTTVEVVAVPVTGVSLSLNISSLEEGQTQGLTATVAPANATNSNVIWSSNNEAIATVSSVGLVTAISAGNAIITVTTVDGSFTDTCSYNITQAIEGFDYNNLTIYPDSSLVDFDIQVQGEDDWVHPSVLHFPSNWNGHPYWMGITPYPNTQSPYENPHIFYSDDGDSWETPVGADTPIFDKDTGISYNSDSHIFMDLDGVTMHYLNRAVKTAGGSRIELYSSTDGVDWGSRNVIIETAIDYLSPSVCIYDGKYYMFGVDVTAQDKLCVLEATTVLGTWAEIKRIDTGDLGNIWHPEVRYINGEFIVFSSTGGASGGYLALAKFDDPVNDTEFSSIRNNAAVIAPNDETWNKYVYKSSFIYKSDSEMEMFVGFKGNALDSNTDWRVNRSDVNRINQTLDLASEGHEEVASYEDASIDRDAPYWKYAIQYTVGTIDCKVKAFGRTTSQHTNLRITNNILEAEIWLGAISGTILDKLSYGLSVGDTVTYIFDGDTRIYINSRLIHTFVDSYLEHSWIGLTFGSMIGTASDVKIYQHEDTIANQAVAQGYRDSLHTDAVSNPTNYWVADKFDRADGSVGDSDNGVTWEVVGTPTIVSNRFKAGSATSAILVPVSGNYEIVFDNTDGTLSERLWAIFLKFDDMDNYVRFRLHDYYQRYIVMTVRTAGVSVDTNYTVYDQGREQDGGRRIYRFTVIDDVVKVYADNIIIQEFVMPSVTFADKVGISTVYVAGLIDDFICKKLI